MVKDTSISIRLDSSLKEQTENVLDQFGLNMTVVVNMLFRQIVRDQAIPLSLSLKTKSSVVDDLLLAKSERLAGYIGREADIVADEMELLISGVQNGAKTI